MEYRIRELRKEKRWTRGELARKSGVSRANIVRKYERCSYYNRHFKGNS